MKAFFTFLLVLVKIYIFVRVAITLYMTSKYPDSHPIDELIWWTGFLIFDLWLLKQLPPDSTEETES
jgi:hypothetical protein